MFWLYLIAAIVAVAWLPVFLRFYWNWRQRRNPISLAICGSVGFFVYFNGALFIFTDAGLFWTEAVLVGLNALGCLHFYLSFWWAKRRFQDNRS